MLNNLNTNIYPKFLITVLNNADRNYVKEACCRMIIKYFSKSKNKSSGADDKGGEGGADQAKIQFINLVEPLASIIGK